MSYEKPWYRIDEAELRRRFLDADLTDGRTIRWLEDLSDLSRTSPRNVLVVDRRRIPDGTMLRGTAARPRPVSRKAFVAGLAKMQMDLRRARDHYADAWEATSRWGRERSANWAIDTLRVYLGDGRLDLEPLGQLGTPVWNERPPRERWYSMTLEGALAASVLRELARSKSGGRCDLEECGAAWFRPTAYRGRFCSEAHDRTYQQRHRKRDKAAARVYQRERRRAEKGGQVGKTRKR